MKGRTGCAGHIGGRSLLRPLAWLLAVMLLVQPNVSIARDRDIMVKAVKTGKVLVIDVEMPVNATVDDAWDVMTDWGNMEKFIPNMTSSDIVSHTGNEFRVKQVGKVPLGPFSVDYEAVRDIEVFPQESLRFRGVSGSFERLDGTVKFSADGEVTRIVYRAESVPTVWMPPFFGTAMVEHATRVQFGEMRVETLRRATGKAARQRSTPSVTKQAP